MFEKWDLYTKDRQKTGLKHVRGNAIPNGYYHIVVEVWTIIDHKRILLTKRHPDKPYGLLLECTGGSILSNEDSMKGAIREIKEEIGLVITEWDLEKVMEYMNEDTIYDVYMNYQSEDCVKRIKLQEEEVVDKMIVTYKEFSNLITRGEIIPKLSYFNRLVEEGKVRLTTA
jgi:8-oxo-dGTP pyrophosphatase MutT (NUDIX family)